MRGHAYSRERLIALTEERTRFWDAFAEGCSATPGDSHLFGIVPQGYEHPETRAAREALGGSFDGAPLFPDVREYEALAAKIEADPLHQAVMAGRIEHGRRVTLTLNGKPLDTGYADIPAGDRGNPIGVVESIDHERGIATVRLGAPLVGYIGTGTA